MPASPNETQASIHGPIMPAEADSLRDSMIDPVRKQEFLKTLGASADANSVALVVTPPKEGGQPVADHFVSLHPQDMGTELLPQGKAAQELRLPAPDVAHALLQQNPNVGGPNPIA